MYGRVAGALLLALLGILVATDGAVAGPPWASLVPFQKIDADPKKSYALTDDHGPWLILAASFSGEGAEQQAQELVIELRKRYKLEAYTFKRRLEDTETRIGLGLNKYGEPKRMKPVNPYSLEEVAVMVGSYSSVEDSRAQKALQTLKYAKPDALDLNKRKSTTQNLAFMRYAQQKIQEVSKLKTAEKGPMRSAMITTNPLLPPEFFRQGELDKLVVSMNEGVENSLFNCPGQYTVKVATFRGKDTMLLKEIDHLNKEKAVSDKLDVGAEKAIKMTAALRRRGYEAYVFHDRHESVVTVGSFDSAGEPRQDGKIEINPAMKQLIDTFKAKQQNMAGLAGAAMRPQLLEGIAFDVQPMPVAVPRKSIGSDYNRGD